MPQFIKGDRAILVVDDGYEEPIDPPLELTDEIKIVETPHLRFEVSTPLLPPREFSEQSYRDALDKFLREVDVEARQVLREYGITAKDIEFFGIVPIPVSEDSTVPESVYRAARCVELISQLGAEKVKGLYASALHSVAMIVELVRISELDVLEQDLQWMLDQQSRAGKGRRGYRSPLNKLVRRICERLENPSITDVLEKMEDDDLIKDLFYSDSDPIPINQISVNPAHWEDLGTVDLLREGKIIFRDRKGNEKHARVKTIQNYISDYKKSI